MALTFTLNDQPFDGTPDAYGVRWYGSVTGWNGPPMSTSLTPRPGDHGAFRGPSYFNSRKPVLAGHAICPDLTALRAAKDRLDDFAPIGVDVELTSSEERTAIVQLGGELLKNAINEQTLNFSIPLDAADPWKYGPQQQVTIPLGTTVVGTGARLFFPLRLYVDNGVTVVNEGTQLARPVLTYWGPCSGPFATNNTLGVTDGYDLTLPTADDFLVVDHDLGSVLLGGTAPRRGSRVPTYRPWELQPRVLSSLTAGAVSSGAGAHVDVTWFPTYL